MNRTSKRLVSRVMRVTILVGVALAVYQGLLDDNAKAQLGSTARLMASRVKQLMQTVSTTSSDIVYDENLEQVRAGIRSQWQGIGY